MDAAKKFYKEQADKLANCNFTFDIICSSVDQFGLLEMKVLLERTGGNLIFNDTYQSDVFRKSLMKLFCKYE